MERWEPWVRAYTAVGEMMQGINFQTRRGNAFQVLSAASLIAEIERPLKSTFEAQIPMVLSWAELRNERATEIMAQIDPQYAFWSSIVYMHPDRTKRTFELINIAAAVLRVRGNALQACARVLAPGRIQCPGAADDHDPGARSLPERTRDAGPCGSLRAEKAAEPQSGEHRDTQW